MRLWSLHPSHLDRIGLVAGWREALLAQAVLAGQTAGYLHHPQLARFRGHAHPLTAISAYLRGLHAEANERGYRFNEAKILEEPTKVRLGVTLGQLDYEWAHLGAKLKQRSPADAERWTRSLPSPHPLFFVVDGAVEAWERV